MDQKQKERYQRGEDFQEELRRSWRLLSNLWRLRINDSSGTRPADELIITKSCNILAELKRTSGKTFSLSMLREGQLKGLLDFDTIIDQNLGLVFVSFLNEDTGLDTAYCFRLVTALKEMKSKNKKSLQIGELSRIGIKLPVRFEKGERIYKLKEVLECWKSL